MREWSPLGLPRFPSLLVLFGQPLGILLGFECPPGRIHLLAFCVDTELIGRHRLDGFDGGKFSKSHTQIFMPIHSIFFGQHDRQHSGCYGGIGRIR